MNESSPPTTAEASFRGFEAFWIRNNIDFLRRYWSTARHAINSVALSPVEFPEFGKERPGEAYVRAVLSNHLENHNYAGVLLTYASLDEFLRTLTGRLRQHFDAPLDPSELRDRGIRQYRKFVHQVCRVPEETIDIDWPFLLDLSIVRNAIIHANGNGSIVGDRKELDRTVGRHPGQLGFKHRSKLVVADEFVLKSLSSTERAAIALNDLMRDR